jgi:hypothetical protein
MEAYAGKQFVGIDLHRRRTVIVRTTEAGEVLETVRIVNDVERLASVMAVGTVTALNECTITVPQGRICALIGGPQAPQGYARTTRLRPDRRQAAGSGQGRHAIGLQESRRGLSAPRSALQCPVQDTRLDISLRPFHHRPAWVLGADRFAAASLERVDNPVLARLPLVGALDQLLDCTDVLSHPALTSPMRCYYDAMAAENPRQTRNGGQLRGTNAHA